MANQTEITSVSPEVETTSGMRSRWVLLILWGFCGMVAVGCGSSEPVQQTEQQAAPADSADQAEEEESTEMNQAQIRALKAQYRDQLQDMYQSEANELTSFYIHAQRLFYNGDYKNALLIINKALELRENADLLALKGSIHLGLNNIDQFKTNWQKALELDENVPLPLTDNVVNALQQHGLLNENLERNF